MSVLVVGISHNSAPVSLLERVALPADGSVQNYSTPLSNQVFSANWQLERQNP